MTGANSGGYSRFLSFHGRNPDVLNSIANLSNDEVFTPPEFANRMLDTLEKAWAESNSGENIWSNPNLKFLDPFTKSGVFLREIATRLISGLESEIPDLQKRVDHILTKQVYGIATTRLTSLMARRSLYCSKKANGKHSVTKKFNNENGNIWFEPIPHTWNKGTVVELTMDEYGKEVERYVDGKCKYCGASKRDFDREEGLELHAYGLIHTDDPKKWVREMFGDDVHFDVIIGNPPYQLETGGSGRQAKPIYQKFVSQAQALEPRFLSMVIPSRWMSGGMGLSVFRSEMLESRKIRHLVDFASAKDVFSGINLNGGVSYFLWDKSHSGSCDYVFVPPGAQANEPLERELGEFDILVRRNEALGIVRKVLSKGEESFSKGVSTIDPFGFPTNFHGVDSKTAVNSIKLFGSGKSSWVSERSVTKSRETIDSWKVLVARATDGNEVYPLPIWDLKGPFVASPQQVCSWTYLVARIAETEQEAAAVAKYMRTRFFRFLVWLRKPTQDNKADNFSFVPVQDWSCDMTDEYLFSRYGLTDDDIKFVEAMIRPMELENG
jgi:site-specific DNA-methyltransferase (adenine-specific)